MAGRLEGKRCIITGTGGGIGRASALWFAREGARIVGCDIKSEWADITQGMVRDAGGTIDTLSPVDLTTMAGCEKLIDFALEKMGGFDILFNNASMAYFGWMEDFTEEDFKRTYLEETTIVFLLCKAAWPHMVDRKNVSIINVASASAHSANPAVPGIAHTGAKAAVLSMTRQLAMEGAKHQIRCNSISPGPTVTNQTEAFINNPEFWDVMGPHIMLGRPGRPEDIAGCAVFLASDESSWITGTDIRVDGGMTAW